MRRLIGLLVLGFSLTPLWGQDEPSGEFRAFYSTIQSFDFDSGAGVFRVSDDAFHGGGFGFVFNLTPWFGLYSDTVFYGGVEDSNSNIGLKLINQTQGAKLTARELGDFNLYGKAGMGFTRFVFDVAQGEAVYYQTSFQLAGGVDIPIREGTYFYVEAGRSILSLPNLTNLPGRDKWSGSLGLTAGIAFAF